MARVAQVSVVERLRDEIARIAHGEQRVAQQSTLPFGLHEIDGLLVHGGLDRHALHEVAAGSSALCDDAAATLFIGGLGARLAKETGTVLWIMTRLDLYAPGLEQAGLSAGRVLHAEADDDAQALALVEDGLRHGTLAAVVAEVRRADMTATRRLQLASAESRTPVVLLRRWRKRDVCPLTEPSAAATRWRITCAPSAPLGYAGVGRGRWVVELARQRNGNPFTLTLEACDDQGRLALPADAADRAAAAGGAVARAA